MQSGVDDVHSGIAQCAGDNPHATIVTVESNFGQEYTNGLLRHLKTSLRVISGSSIAGRLDWAGTLEPPLTASAALEIGLYLFDKKHPALAQVHELDAVPDGLRHVLA